VRFLGIALDAAAGRRSPRGVETTTDARAPSSAARRRDFVARAQRFERARVEFRARGEVRSVRRVVLYETVSRASSICFCLGVCKR